jgi:hypothetical protein
MLNRFYLTALVASALILPNAYTAGFVPVYLDEENEGYNDPTVVTSDITGQSTTLGADRKACLEAAMALLETHLNITVDIRVQAQFIPLEGNANSAILGGAGPIAGVNDFTNAPVSSTIFTIAQANQLFGSDIFSGSNDVDSVFNSDVDGTFVLGTTTWYYGTDGNVPADHIDFYSTAIHELCHGIGFLSYMISSTGVLGNGGGLMDIYTSFLRREGEGLEYRDYTAMSDAERAAGNISVDELVWKGVIVETEHGSKPLMYAPDPVEGGSSVSHWDKSNSPNLIMEPSATDAFTDISLERQLFDDIHWPLLAISDLLDPDNVYIKFNAPSNGIGTLESPFDNLSDAVTAASSLANIRIVTSSSTETFTESASLGNTPNKNLTLINRTPGFGVVTIGAAPPAFQSTKTDDSGFVTRE